jgi:hypothetical protein
VQGIYPPVGSKNLLLEILMAQYEHLPIYKKVMEVAVYFEKIVRISKEAHAFKSFKSFQHAIESVISVSRHSKGWIKSVSS